MDNFTLENILLAITDISVTIPFLFPGVIVALLVVLAIVSFYGQSIIRDLKDTKRNLETSRANLYAALDKERASVREKEVQIESLNGTILARDDTIEILRHDARVEFGNILRNAIDTGELGEPLPADERPHADQFELFETQRTPEHVDGITRIAT